VQQGCGLGELVEGWVDNDERERALDERQVEPHMSTRIRRR
jgi:hypothetical protein